MKLVNPKYIPREWMLKEAYTKADQGDYSIIIELHQLFLKPYDEQPHFQDKYYMRAPNEIYEGKGAGILFMSCSS